MCSVSFPAATLSAEIEDVPVHPGNMGLYGFAAHDGFDRWLDFVRFFVPKPGGRFIRAYPFIAHRG